MKFLYVASFYATCSVISHATARLITLRQETVLQNKSICHKSHKLTNVPYTGQWSREIWLFSIYLFIFWQLSLDNFDTQSLVLWFPDRFSNSEWYYVIYVSCLCVTIRQSWLIFTSAASLPPLREVFDFVLLNIHLLIQTTSCNFLMVKIPNETSS